VVCCGHEPSPKTAVAACVPHSAQGAPPLFPVGNEIFSTAADLINSNESTYVLYLGHSTYRQERRTQTAEARSFYNQALVSLWPWILTVATRRQWEHCSNEEKGVVLLRTKGFCDGIPNLSTWRKSSLAVQGAFEQCSRCLDHCGQKNHANN
jgi:hypothetical protein